MYFPSLKVQAVNPDKAYCIDTGLANCVAFRISKDTGRLYENVVFMELTRQGKELYYWKDQKGRETDFLVKEGGRVVMAVQVSYQMEDEKTRRREVEGLLECLRNFDLMLLHYSPGQRFLSLSSRPHSPLFKRKKI